MRQLLLLAGLAAAVLAFAASASANTTVSVSMHFTEPVLPGFVQGCPVVDTGFCGGGEVRPRGSALTPKTSGSPPRRVLSVGTSPTVVCPRDG
jgi:hypothetical protein